MVARAVDETITHRRSQEAGRNPVTRNGRQNFRTRLCSIGHCVSARLGSCRCSHASGYRSHQGKAELGRGHGRRGAQELCGRPQQAIPPQHVRPRGQDAQRSPAPAKELASSKFAPVTSLQSVCSGGEPRRSYSAPARCSYSVHPEPEPETSERSPLCSPGRAVRIAPDIKAGPAFDPANHRIAIWAFGSRGDVQPYVALCVALQEAGYDVMLILYADCVSVRRCRCPP